MHGRTMGQPASDEKGGSRPNKVAGCRILQRPGVAAPTGLRYGRCVPGHFTRNALAALSLGLLLSAADSLCAAAVKPGTGTTLQMQFRAPELQNWIVSSNATSGTWLATMPGGTRTSVITSRLVLRADAATRESLLGDVPNLKLVRVLDDRTVLLEASDPLAASRLAEAWSRLPEVEAAVPIFRKRLARHFAYAPAPNDPYFTGQTYLETADPIAGLPPGPPDLRVRSAWPWSRGRGVTVAVVDDGVEVAHPDLSPNAVAGHFNFVTGLPTGGHSTIFQTHGTSVAGIASARGGNGLGISGVAPESGWLSWVIFDAVDNAPADDELAQMFENGRHLGGTNGVAVQNHSWGNSEFEPLAMSLVESLAISNAVTAGRGGRGTVLIRSSGNTRTTDYSLAAGVGDANLDAYASDYRQITVAAVRNDGRVASYSTPGACVWLAAMGGDPTDSASPGLFTTDRLGSRGANSTANPNDPALWDYAFGSSGFYGTSAAAPQVAGIVALMLSARPELGWRDVQQILAVSARHVDLADPALQTNGAGFRVSPNVGFGIPDAGQAVRIAQIWNPRPPATVLSWTNAIAQPIPDDGLRVLPAGDAVPAGHIGFGAAGSVGVHVDRPTAELPVYAGGQLPVPAPAAGSYGLLIPGGTASIASAIDAAADAGAAFVLVQATQGTDDRSILRNTGFVRIPAVQIGRASGDTLKSWIASPSGVRAKLQLNPARWTFSVSQMLSLEHVEVHMNWHHPRLQDLRVTLRSPAGTLSVLNRPGGGTQAVPASWTYQSAMHLGESSVGTWTVEVTDEAPGMTGSVDSVVLTLRGVPILDTDADGLDDAWEQKAFGGLSARPAEDPDLDGYSNVVEQWIGTNPVQFDAPLLVQAAVSGPGTGGIRLSWPGRNAVGYEVLSAADPAGPWTVAQSIVGRFPETGWLVPVSPESATQYFRVREASSN